MAEAGGARVAAWAVAGVLVALGGWQLVRGDGDRPPGGARLAVEGPGAAAGAAAEGGARAGARSAAGRLHVHVAGAVRRPGLYRIARGARVAAAVARAGGPSRRGDLTGVNLAAPLADGQQVVVPARGAAALATPGAAAAAGAGGQGGAPGATGARVSLGSATVEQLDALDGIGPTLAARIVEQRQRSGGFRSVEDLREVEGIGDKRFESLREAVTP